MSQFNAGSVRVENASTTVTGILEVYLVSVVNPPFVPGNTLNWGADGVGKVTSWSGASNRLRFYRTSGSLPAVGNTITETGGSPPNGTIDSLGTATPPNYNTELSVGDTLVVVGDGVKYDISGGLTADTFTINVAYAGTTTNEAPFGVTTDFTVNRSYVKLSTGEVEALTLMGLLAEQIDTDIYQQLFREFSITYAASINVDWSKSRLQTMTFGAGNTTTVTFTAPDGPQWTVLRLVQDGTGGRTISGWPSMTWERGQPVIDPSANAQTLLFFYYDGTNWTGWHHLAVTQSVSSSGGTATFNWKNGEVITITLTENTTVSFTDPAGPGRYSVVVTQDASSTYTITWPASVVLWTGGVDPTWATSEVALLDFVYDGTNWYGSETTDLQ